jgi:SGT1 protein
MLLIPPIPNTPLETESPSLQDAISFIQSNPTKLFRSIEVEAEAFRRLRDFAANPTYQIHGALVTMPRKVAYLLHHKDAYISPAVEAFYLRDLVSLEPLITCFDPKALKFPPEDFVTTSVRFTKVGYGQLKLQKFPAPPLWANKIAKTPEAELPRALLGMHLTCGFEMLLSDKLYQDKPAVREIQILLEDLGNGDEKLPSDEEIATWSQRNDDDSWLNIDWEAFEKELAGKGIDPSKMDGFGDKTAQGNLRKLVSQLDGFLDDESAGPDGAEMDDDRSENSESDDEAVNKDPKLDTEKFKRIIHEIMGADGADDLVDDLADLADLDPSELQRRLEEMESESESEAEAESESDEEDDIEAEMAAAEAELRELGIFGPIRPPKSKGKAKAIQQSERKPSQEDTEREDEDVDVDFTVAKNMLEAFKAQGGMPGPAGNLMGLMGVNLPPDMDDEKKPPKKIR